MIYYEVIQGEKFSGQKGEMVGGHTDSSYDDIQIKLKSGITIWRSRTHLTKITEQKYNS